MSAACERAIWQTGLPVIGLRLSKYSPATGGDPFAADEIVVAGPQGYPRVQRLDNLVKHGVLPRTWAAFFFCGNPPPAP